MNTSRILAAIALAATLATAARASTSWEALFLAPDSGTDTAIRALPDGGAILLAYHTAYRFDDRGAIVWTRRFGPQVYVLDAAPEADGSLLLVGQFVSLPGWLARLSADGSVLWERTMPTVAFARTSAIAAAPGGGAYVVGSVSRSSPYARDAWLLRVDDAGVVVWQQSIGTLKDADEN